KSFPIMKEYSVKRNGMKRSLKHQSGDANGTRRKIWLPLSLLVVASLTSAVWAADGGCQNSSAAVYKQASPAVVYITATSINPYRLADRVEHIVGSGFIINEEGLVLTNSHVAYGRQSIMVKLDNGETLQAKLLGADPLFDIAVLQ